MATTRVRFAFPVAVLLAGMLALSPAAQAGAATNTVKVPEVVGEPLNLAAKAIDALDLEVKTSADGRSVFVKKNWIVVRQSPAAGKEVAPGTKVTLYVIKKSEVVKEGTALGACRAWAKSDPDLKYGIEFPSFDWASSKRDLGWSIDADAWIINATGGKVAARVYCEVEGTNKKPKVIAYEVTAR